MGFWPRLSLKRCASIGRTHRNTNTSRALTKRARGEASSLATASACNCEHCRLNLYLGYEKLDYLKSTFD